MNRLYAILAAGSLLAGVAAAQDDQKIALEKMVAQVRVVSLQTSVMGKPVKGAPYSGVEVNETTQMLADGTRIHNETQTQVFRDSEGRLRRETPNEITIWDPVANTSYLLNPKTQTARKLPMGNFVYTRTGNGEVVRTTNQFYFSDTKTGAASDAEMGAKIKAELQARTRGTAGPDVGIARTMIIRNEKGSSESLGKRTIEGVNSEGTRMVMTTEVGAIGNDRPIQSVTEKWFSPELQITMTLRHTDPRTGEETFKLINVNRAEPAAYLFQVPAGYQIVEQK